MWFSLFLLHKECPRAIESLWDEADRARRRHLKCRPYSTISSSSLSRYSLNNIGSSLPSLSSFSSPNTSSCWFNGSARETELFTISESWCPISAKRALFNFWRNGGGSPLSFPSFVHLLRSNNSNWLLHGVSKHYFTLRGLRYCVFVYLLWNANEELARTSMLSFSWHGDQCENA